MDWLRLVVTVVFGATLGALPGYFAVILLGMMYIGSANPYSDLFGMLAGMAAGMIGGVIVDLRHDSTSHRLPESK